MSLDSKINAKADAEGDAEAIDDQLAAQRARAILLALSRGVDGCYLGHRAQQWQSRPVGR
ncbi:hypothetical protein [Poseidonocella pacifica]|uniref:hypothetical protein n=1 Tax=Poseidonocella pacifica TaxID=871651 RepID=UPI000B85DD3E|nr:hypothetical protein [Poseidonocella pacifica]